jgi:beta-lactamase class A
MRRRAFLASLLMVACGGRAQAMVSERPPRVEPTPTATGPTLRRRADAPPTPIVDDGSLQRQLQRFLREQRGIYGVAVRDLHGPVVADYEPRERFPLGSLYKLHLTYEVMRHVRAGAVGLADTVRTPVEYSFGEPQGGVPPGTQLSVEEALATMIAVSSNAAALALIDVVRPSGLAAAPARIGLAETAIDVAATGEPGHYEIDARGSARDVVDILVRLDRETLVGPEQDRRIVDMLLGQRIVDRLPALLPSDVPIAHKTADLDGFTHDAGMVYLPGRPYAIALLAQGESPLEGKAVVAEVSRLVFSYFQDGR